MDERGQLDNPLIFFAVLVVALMIFAPITLKIFSSFSGNFTNSLQNVSGGTTAVTNFNAVTTPLINFWDKLMLIAFVVMVLLLFVSAFLIDAHPIFVILYIITNFLLVIFAPNIISIADTIYTSADFATERGLLPFMDALRSHYVLILVGLMIITGIIIYGKIAFTGGNRNK